MSLHYKGPAIVCNRLQQLEQGHRQDGIPGTAGGKGKCDLLSYYKMLVLPSFRQNLTQSQLNTDGLL
jgi:hypothetical protein